MTDQASRRPGYRSNLIALERAQKPSYRTAAYGRYVNRPLGRRVAALAHVAGLTPNGASVISAAMSAVAILLVALVEPSLPMSSAVAVLLAAGYVMDSVDGQLARLRGGGSLSGEWLDHTIDCFKTSSLHLAVLVSWYRFPPIEEPAWLLVPIVYELVAVVLYFELILMPTLRARAGPASQGPTREPLVDDGPTSPTEHPARPWLTLPTDYGFLCWLFILMAWPLVFLWAYSAMAVLSSVMLALALGKWWKELRPGDRLA